MELLCLLGAALSLAATVLESLRDSMVFLFLWIIYLSMYQVSYTTHTHTHTSVAGARIQYA